MQILHEAEWVIFFFQAEDGIRDVAVTGVQTCALPICRRDRAAPGECERRREQRAGSGERSLTVQHRSRLPAPGSQRTAPRLSRRDTPARISDRPTRPTGPSARASRPWTTREALLVPLRAAQHLRQLNVHPSRTPPT